MDGEYWGYITIYGGIRRIDNSRYKKLKPRFCRVLISVYGSVKLSVKRSFICYVLGCPGLFAHIRLGQFNTHIGIPHHRAHPPLPLPVYLQALSL